MTVRKRSLISIRFAVRRKDLFDKKIYRYKNADCHPDGGRQKNYLSVTVYCMMSSANKKMRR